jgi:hypothetical protein
MSGDKGSQKYIAAPPERLLHIAEEEAKERLNIRHRIHAILPNLKSLYKGTKIKPEVRIYEGEESVITLMEETLKIKNKPMRVYSANGVLPDRLRNYIPIYIQKRIAQQIPMHLIHPDTPFEREISKHLPSCDKTTYIPSEKFDFSSDYGIYDDRVIFISKEKNSAIEIQSAEIATALRSTFDLAFEGARHLYLKETNAGEKGVRKTKDK